MGSRLATLLAPRLADRPMQTRWADRQPGVQGCTNALLLKGPEAAPWVCQPADVRTLSVASVSHMLRECEVGGRHGSCPPRGSSGIAVGCCG
jgi:hypothetical protein